MQKKITTTKTATSLQKYYNNKNSEKFAQTNYKSKNTEKFTKNYNNKKSERKLEFDCESERTCFWELLQLLFKFRYLDQK